MRISGAAGLFFAGMAALFAAPGAASAQNGDKSGGGEDKSPPTIEEKTKGYDAIEGLFPLYQDPETGGVLMEISAERLGEEFIVFSYTENGVLEAGHFRGAYRDQRIVSLNKHYKNMEFVEENTSYYFDPENAVSRAAEANISPAIVASVPIVAVTGEGDEARYLIDADKLFLNESLHQVKPFQFPGQQSGPSLLGGLSSSKTKYADLRNYPENMDVVVDYVFDGAPLPTSAAVTDSRSVTIRLQHTFVAMPDEGFEPRADDYRVGYFTDRVTDQTSFSPTPYRDLVNRWRLVKKDPDAALSEPVEPIVWWIENTTPVEYRETIREAALYWNQSFEKAGFKNAVEVKVQPDDADWDAGDIRYNVLRWTSSPIPPFGGYGPSFTNPRTGEILGADVMLEFSFLSGNAFVDQVFNETGAPDLAAMALKAPPETAPGERSDRSCSAGLFAQRQLAFSLAAAEADGAGEEEISEIRRQWTHFLILHEIGHTLGLNHNMKASSWRDPVSVHDASITDGQIIGSVMDYPAVNAAPPGVEQGDWQIWRPGPYDDWAIEFGYRPDLDREALLSRSLEPELVFGNDADDMRSSFNGIDPRTMIGDMSSDMLVYGEQRFDLVDHLVGRIKDRFTEEGESWQQLRDAYFFLQGQRATMARGISRQVGGVRVERFDAGQPGSEDLAPFAAVPEERQRAAIRLLGERIYAADAFALPAELAAHLQTQRRGYDFFFNTEDPKLQEVALSIQLDSLAHFLNPNTLRRLTNAANYGGTYSAREMLIDVNDAVIGGDLRGSPNVYRRNLQVAYVTALRDLLVSGQYDNIAETALLAAIQDVKGRLGMFEFGLSEETKAHRAHIQALLRGF